MKKNQKHIEIVRSNTIGLSSMSQKSCDALLARLQKRYAKVGVSVVNNVADLKAAVAK